MTTEGEEYDGPTVDLGGVKTNFNFMDGDVEYRVRFRQSKNGPLCTLARKLPGETMTNFADGIIDEVVALKAIGLIGGAE